MPSRARVCMERACARVIVCDSRCVKEQERRSCRVARRGEVEGREIDRPQDALESFLDTKMAEKIVRSSTSRAATFFLSLFSPLFFSFLFFFFSFFLPPLSSFLRIRDFSSPPPPPPSLFRSHPYSIWMANLDRCKKTWWCGNRKRLESWLVALQRFDEKRWTDEWTDDFPRREIPFGVCGEECHFAQAAFDAPSPVVNRSYRCFVYDRLPFVAESSLSYNE